ncbi:succinylglutamate desuccinylase [Zobellia amurskyensis]|uniref:Succinylglutamate desuccinylase n=1 Tax=Zobellia amurskyensis TaxID=248905 RepID=A0A7X2ZXM5_9FLAO|nr:succinylglutamate desuccinylase/aspartoacylase family protein [Zobellia amurskyensis]MUH38278.1 succinylglutamate desuccinylase [Zobellia amurskyensis]
MIRTQITKLALALVLTLGTLPLRAQDNFKDAFAEGSVPFTKNIRVTLTDAQNHTASVPITILKGKKEGPVFTILSGVHGFEYPPIIAAQELIQEIDVDRLTGTVIIVPIANTASFFSRTPFNNPLDNVNLNRAFPGDAAGSITQRIAAMFTTDIIPVSDVLLDIHGGDASEDLLPFVCYYNNEQKPEQTQLARRLSIASGFQYMVTYPYTLKDSEPAQYAFKQAVQDGKTALSIESGKLGNVQKEAVASIKKGVYHMLHEMNMYETNGSPTKPIELNGQVYVKADTKGVFYSDLKAGDSVKKGDILGHTKDEFGNIIGKIKAPRSGIILYKIGTPPVNVGETVFCIGYNH